MTSRGFEGFPPIVLMTDFDLSDPFVGMMKGVIHSIVPKVRIIDLSHGIRPQDVFQGAYMLYRSAKYFPKGSVFCAVVDPGVGTDRKPIAIKTRDFYFVGPDNGLVLPAARDNGIETSITLDNKDAFLDGVSHTFHGRDIFAPVSARICSGWQLTSLGSPLQSYVDIEIPIPRKKGDSLVLTILDKDRFGNLTLNISHEDFHTFAGKTFQLMYMDHEINLVFDAYGLAPDDAPFVVAGSSGFMEIAVKNHSAAKKLNANVLDELILSKKTEHGTHSPGV